MTALRIGTRGSRLALAQAELVSAEIRRCGVASEVEIVTIETAGDRGEQGDKSRWIQTIEDALVREQIDLAVHSAKDVPSAAELADGMVLGAVLPREDPRDALVGAGSLDELAPGARVGTASLRRRSQLLSVRPDLEVCELRGNVPTRITKLDGGECDAIILAAAGLARLGMQDRIGALLDPSTFVPAPGQGLIAVEGPAIPPEIIDMAGADALAAERSVVEALGASCDTPVGCYDDGEDLHVYVGAPDGTAWIRDRVEAYGSTERAKRALERLELLGARAILNAGGGA